MHHSDLLTLEGKDPLDLSCLHQICSLQNRCGTMNGRHLARLHAYNLRPPNIRRACANNGLSFLFAANLNETRCDLLFPIYFNSVLGTGMLPVQITVVMCGYLIILHCFLDSYYRSGHFPSDLSD